MKGKNNNHRLITVSICTFAILFGLVFKLLPVFFFHQGKIILKTKITLRLTTALKQHTILTAGIKTTDIIMFLH